MSLTLTFKQDYQLVDPDGVEFAIFDSNNTIVHSVYYGQFPVEGSSPTTFHPVATTPAPNIVRTSLGVYTLADFNPVSFNLPGTFFVIRGRYQIDGLIVSDNIWRVNYFTQIDKSADQVSLLTWPSSRVPFDFYSVYKQLPGESPVLCGRVTLNVFVDEYSFDTETDALAAVYTVKLDKLSVNVVDGAAVSSYVEIDSVPVKVTRRFRDFCIVHGNTLDVGKSSDNLLEVMAYAANKTFTAGEQVVPDLGSAGSSLYKQIPVSTVSDFRGNWALPLSVNEDLVVEIPRADCAVRITVPNQPYIPFKECGGRSLELRRGE